MALKAGLNLAGEIHGEWGASNEQERGDNWQWLEAWSMRHRPPRFFSV